MSVSIVFYMVENGNDWCSLRDDFFETLATWFVTAPIDISRWEDGSRNDHKHQS